MAYSTLSVWASCTSEKDNKINFSWGKEFDSDIETKEQFLTEISQPDWIYDGWAESFWENSWVFQAGVTLAKKYLENDQSLSYEQALFDVFGHFRLDYKLTGIHMIINYDIDVDDTMYTLLSQM